jgi:Uma2 family endonuclease
MSLETEYELYSEEEEMPESNLQLMLMIYLIAVLKHWYAEEGWFVGGNLLIVPRKETQPFRRFKNICPDVMVCHGTVLTEAEQNELSSWDMNQPNRPAPSIVFEICSSATWDVDLDKKPEWYGQIGVQEYFAFDPMQLWRGATRQLRGWRYVNGRPVELTADEQGRLWSASLDSYVVPDGVNLRLTDRRGRQRLTATEAGEVVWQKEQRARRKEELARRKAEEQAKAEQQARLKAEQQAKVEEVARHKAEQQTKAEEVARLEAEQRLEVERVAKEAALREVQELREKLRQSFEKQAE